MQDFTMQQTLLRTIVIPSGDFSQVAVISFESDLKEVGEILEAVKKTITRWQKEYVKGENRIAKLGGNFLIKDLCEFQDDKNLRKLFRENGINYISVLYFASEKHEWKFEEVLNVQKEKEL